MALVVYGVMRAADCQAQVVVEWRQKPITVCTVTHDTVCALAGDAPDLGLRLSRDALLAHSEVLHHAMERGPVLPLRFGVVMPDEAAVRAELLAPSSALFAARLDALEGTAEFKVKVTFDSDRLLSSIVASEGP